MTFPSWSKDAILRRAREQADDLAEPALYECLQYVFSSQLLDQHHVLSSHYDILVFRDVSAIHKSGVSRIELRLTRSGDVEVSVNYDLFRAPRLSSSCHIQIRRVGTSEMCSKYLTEYISELQKANWSLGALGNIFSKTTGSLPSSPENTS